MAFQAPSLLPWRTTVDNVLLPLEIVEPYRSQLQGDSARCRGAGAQALLQKVGPGRLRGQVSLAALRRHAAARQHLPRADSRARRCCCSTSPSARWMPSPRGAVVRPARPAWTEQRFNVILVTHDLRESVFLADTVYVMSKSPGRFVVKRDIDAAAPA